MLLFYLTDCRHTRSVEPVRLWFCAQRCACLRRPCHTPFGAHSQTEGRASCFGGVAAAKLYSRHISCGHATYAISGAKTKKTCLKHNTVTARLVNRPLGHQSTPNLLESVISKTTMGRGMHLPRAFSSGGGEGEGSFFSTGFSSRHTN